MRRRKSSLSISLVLVGTAALSGCDRAAYTNRDMYRTLEDCRRDWNRPDACQQVAGSGGNSASRFYMGPTYDSNSPRGRSMRAFGTASVSRAGFGSSSGFHSSGS